MFLSLLKNGVDSILTRCLSRINGLFAGQLYTFMQVAENLVGSYSMMRVFCPECNGGRWLRLTVGRFECEKCDYAMLDDTLLTYEWETHILWDKSEVGKQMADEGKKVFTIGTYVCAEAYFEIKGCRSCPFMQQRDVWESYYPEPPYCAFYKQDMVYSDITSVYQDQHYRPVWCKMYGITVHEEGLEVG